jgi:hypothetical protein
MISQSTIHSPVCYVILVQVFNSINNLVKEFASLSFCAIFVRYYIIKHFTTFSTLHDEIYAIGCIQNFV